MNIAERIQHLRKTKGISQEQLADDIGVSRQAVSKWESIQSVPDIDRIILLADYFNVSTDYILRGIESNKPDSRVFSIMGTTVNIIGLLISFALWYEKKASYSSIVGLLIIAIGCSVIAIGHYVGSKKTIKLIPITNIWIILFIPFSLASNYLRGFIEGYYPMNAPYPVLGNSISLFLLGYVIYIMTCSIINLIQFKKNTI